MNSQTLSYYEKNKDRVDAAHASLYSPISMDLVVFDADLDRQMDVSLIFDTLERKRQQMVVQSVTPEGKEVSYRLMTVAVGHNHIAGFKKNKLHERVAYIVYDDKDGVKYERPAEHKDKKWVNIGVEGELSYEDATYSVSFWVWNRGSIHVTLGIRKGSPLKMIPHPSKLPKLEAIFFGMMNDLMTVMWDYALSSGNPQQRMPEQKEWRISNNSFTSALLRPWTVQHSRPELFKLETSLLLNYHIIDQPYEGGYIRVARMGREDENDTYFMLDVTFISFDILFRKVKNTHRDGNRYILNGVQINPECWTVDKGRRSEKDTLEILSKEYLKDAVLSIGDSKLRVEKMKDGNEVVYILNADLSKLPHVTLKLYMSGKLQVNGYKGMPLLTAWRGIDCLFTAMTTQGIPTQLQAMMRDKADVFSWLNNMADKSVVDMSVEIKQANGLDGGVKFKLGRRGRKPKNPDSAPDMANGKTLVYIDVNNGKLVIGKTTGNHKTNLLEAAAKMLGLSLDYEDKRKTYLKSRTQITRDIVMTILMRDGIPKYTDKTKDKAIGVTLAIIQEQGIDKEGSTYSEKLALLQQLVDKEIATRTVANKQNNALLTKVKSPEYPDAYLSPPDRRKDRIQVPVQKPKSAIQDMSPVRKQYLVLDAIFGYPSFDI